MRPKSPSLLLVGLFGLITQQFAISCGHTASSPAEDAAALPISMGDVLAPPPDASSGDDSQVNSTTPVAIADGAEAETAWEASTQGDGADAADGADGADASEGAENLFTCGDSQCGSPTFMPAGGAVADGTTVRIIAALGFPSNGVFFYTTDGTLPTHASPTYAGGIVVHTAETINAIAFACGCTDSMLASATYTIAASDGSPE